MEWWHCRMIRGNSPTSGSSFPVVACKADMNSLQLMSTSGFQQASVDLSQSKAGDTLTFVERERIARL
jgi:hypothetical protein